LSGNGGGIGSFGSDLQLTTFGGQDQRHALGFVIMDRNAIEALETFGILDFTGFLDRAIAAFNLAQLARRSAFCAALDPLSSAQETSDCHDGT
jgi:hypothetical protein